MATSDTTPTSFSMNAYASVTTLETVTFNDWRLRLTTVMGAHRLSKYILRDVEPPTESRALDEHETNQMRALAAIHATIDKENFEVVRHCLDPREAFVKLCKHHDDAGGLSTANLFSDLVTLRLSSDGDLKDHIHRFRKLHNDLLSNLSSTPDMKISEPFVAIILMNSLPSNYTPLVQSLLTSFETLTLAKLYSLLNIEATRSLGVVKADTALSDNRSKAKPRFKKRETQPPVTGKDTVVCSLGHPGHSDDHCKVRQWRDFKAYQDMMRGKPDQSLNSGKQRDTAQLARDTSFGAGPDSAVDVSYYDTAFSAIDTRLPTVMDTGASSHMFGDKNVFSSLHPTTTSHIGVASMGGSIQSTSRGCVKIGHLTLRNVLYSNQLTGNLISVGRLCDDGYSAVFRKKDGVILDKDRCIVIWMKPDPWSDQLWHPCVNLSNQALFTSGTKTDLATLWHRCLGHAHPDAVIHYLHHHTKRSLSRKHFQPCDACTLGKLQQSPSTSSFRRATRVLDVIHSDLIGPITPSTNSGYRYILTFVDDYTRYNHI